MITLMQNGFIYQIITLLNLSNGKSKNTPVDYGALPADGEGEPTKRNFNYVSVIRINDVSVFELVSGY